MIKQDEIDNLVHEYFKKEWTFIEEGRRPVFPNIITHRFDEYSSAVLYSFVRKFRPQIILEIGTYEGGATNVIMQALKKNQDHNITFVASELDNDRKCKTAVNLWNLTKRMPIMIGDITKNLFFVPNELDMLFIDTDHDLETTQWIYKHILPRVKRGGFIVMHDWAVIEVKGQWVAKEGAWPETEYIIKLHEKGELPLKPLFWTYKNPHNYETGFWLKL